MKAILRPCPQGKVWSCRAKLSVSDLPLRLFFNFLCATGMWFESFLPSFPDTVSRLPLSSNQVTTGWRLMNADGLKLLPAQLSSLESHAKKLTAKNLLYQMDVNGQALPIYGVCIVEQTADSGHPSTVKRYRSKVFEISPSSNEVEVPDERPRMLILCYLNSHHNSSAWNFCRHSNQWSKERVTVAINLFWESFSVIFRIFVQM